MATTMDLPTLLVKVVMRSFYEDKFIVLMDFILRERLLTDDALADRMRFSIRDVAKVAAKLREDRLLWIHSRQETREDEKVVTRSYYYIDFALFADVVKLRLYKMRKYLEEKELGDKGYMCQTCKRAYDAFDVVRLQVNPHTHAFACEICGGELESTDASMLSGDSRLLSRLVEATNPITRLLKQLEDVEIPDFDPEDYIRTKANIIVDGDGEGEEGDDFSMLKMAGAGDKRSKSDVSVELVDDSMNAGPAAKKTIHALPEWYSHSTVTGQALAPAAPKASDQSPVEVTSNVRNTGAAADAYIKQYEAKAATANSVKTVETVQVETIPPPPPPEPQQPQEDIQVLVKGVPKSIHSITEEDKNEMTEEEYQKYYEAYMSSL